MQKLVYKFDGTPTIINENVEYAFDYTETPPPEGIYSPFFFDGSEWIGTSEEDYENNNPPSKYEPSNSEMQLASTQMQLTKTVVQLQETQKKLADSTLEIAKMKGEI